VPPSLVQECPPCPPAPPRFCVWKPLESRWNPTKIDLDAAGLLTVSGFQDDLTVTQSSTVPGRFAVKEGSLTRFYNDVTAVTIQDSHQKAGHVAVDLGGFGLGGTLTIDCDRTDDAIAVSAADGATVRLAIHLGGGADTLTLSGSGAFSGFVDGGASSQNHDRPQREDTDTLVVAPTADLSALAVSNFEVT
jgi:hypothetical protein